MQRVVSSFATDYGIGQFALNALEKFCAEKPLNERIFFVMAHDEMGVAADKQKTI